MTELFELATTLWRAREIVGGRLFSARGRTNAWGMVAL
ncbi:hypothetical protein LMG29542_02607 [Paraburkholderia humisilvae]|uniref:Uncharacterized protein n=1 Tax=Paraburkholderia humisilvae TaxID=627669 RepID=A0A6J5DQG4_9BURK|nr:hypothetical protein LMG29542_02607 [Paraburkholderia humisilvae]